MHTWPRLLPWCLLLVLLVSSARSTWCLAQSSSGGQPQLNVVLYVPADVDPPADVGRRFIQIAQYTEQFLVDEMTKNGYPPAVTEFLPRDEKGNYKFLFIKGELLANSDRWDKRDVYRDVIDAAVKKYNFSRDQHVWWIWMYLGDPPKRYSDYRGGGSSMDGGWAICNYTNIPGEIDPKIPQAAGFNLDFTLKACIHELGHAMGLPHTGPKSRDRRGNTLMGPQSKVYAKKVDDREKKVYLCEASAAILWKHPILTGTTKDRRRMPKFEVKDLKGEVNRQGRFLEIQGEIQSDIPAHSVVVFDGGDDSYFRKSYVGKVDADGKFSVEVKELDHEKGKLLISFCFENGVFTGYGDGKAKKLGLENAIVRPYQATRTSVELLDAVSE